MIDNLLKNDNTSNDNKVYCQHCGQLVDTADDLTILYNWDGRVLKKVCSECLDTLSNNGLIYQCDDCGRWYNTRLNRVRHHGRVCELCLPSYYYCGECGDWVLCDEWDNEADACTSCARKEKYKVKDYYYRPYIHYYKDASEAGKPCHFLGFELEIGNNYDDNDSTRADLIEKLYNIVDEGHEQLYFKHDSSISHGFEIISQPHTYKALKKLDIDAILNECKDAGYYSHTGGSCGLHLHISRSILGDTPAKQKNTLDKLVYFTARNLSELKQLSRRDWARFDEWSGGWSEYVDDKASARYIIDNYSDEHYKRYHALNLTNTATIEWRFFRGTLKASSFRACIDFLYHITLNAKRISWANIDDLGKWLAGMDKNTYEYIKKRHAFSNIIPASTSDAVSDEQY